MVTEADREAAANILDEVSNLLANDEIGQVADLIRDGEYDEHEVVSIVDRHRTASTAALTAEIQRLREEVNRAAGRLNWCATASPGVRDKRGMALVLGWADETRAALSTPSEVSEPVADAKAESDKIGGWVHRRMKEAATRSLHEPVADESGGETMDWSEAVDFVDRFDLPISMVPDLVSPNTNGDAVREALEALKPFAAVAENDIGEDEADADLFRPMSSRHNRAPLLTVGDLRRALATLAKHGGATNV